MSETSTVLIQWGSIVLLSCFSALFSGLTLGLLSLDKIGLKIVMSGGDEHLAALAATIAPVRENGNLLLCTLLLGNVAVNAYLSILMAEITSASCSRYALQIGSKCIPIVKVLILLMYPITFPLKLLRIHVQHGAMDEEQGQISEGAITYVDKKVSEVMSPFDESFLLSASDQLNFKKITEIFKSGFSRIPVYDKDKHDIIGILLVKDLIFVDPDDETPVRNFIQIFGRNFHLLWPDDKLGDVLRMFKTGKSHMAIVRDVNNSGEGDPFYEMKGIVTLEDIIEEILQDEIHDETDAVGVSTLGSDADQGFDYSKLRLLDSGKLEYEKLTEAEALAIGAHFAKNTVAGSNGVEVDLMELLLDSCPVIDQTRIAPMDEGPATQDFFYMKDKSANFMIMVLTGKLTVLAGRDGFRSEAGPWSVIGADALRTGINEATGTYTPDFSAYISSPEIRYIKISRNDFAKALRGEYVWRIAAPSKGLVFRSAPNDASSENDPETIFYQRKPSTESLAISSIKVERRSDVDEPNESSGLLG
eukprot:GSChrysophyteH1.ASY1.ANO1.1184.1 assembled CDS